MADTEKSPAMLLDELASLHPQARHKLATTLRQVSQTFAEVPDGKTASHYWREHRPRIDYCFDGDRLCPVSTIGQTLDDLLGIADPDAALPQIDPDARRRLTALVNAAATAL